jgi:hypothetical protein
MVDGELGRDRVVARTRRLRSVSALHAGDAVCRSWVRRVQPVLAVVVETACSAGPTSEATSTSLDPTPAGESPSDVSGGASAAPATAPPESMNIEPRGQPSGPAQAVRWFESVVGACGWFELSLPAGGARQVGTLAFDCALLKHVACTKVACVVVRDETEVWRLDAVTGAVVRLADPPGEIWDAGVSRDGAPLVFTMEGGAPRADRSIQFQGRTYSGNVSGEPILVHALRWETGRWRRYETRLSDTGIDCARGLAALSSWREDRSWPPKDPRGAFSSRMREVALDDALVGSLAGAASRVRTFDSGEGAWVVGDGDGSARLAWFSDWVECTWQPELPLFLGRGGDWRALDGPLPRGAEASRVDALDVTVGARHALASWSGGAALLELAEGAVVWRRPGVTSAMLWPPPAVASLGR